MGMQLEFAVQAWSRLWAVCMETLSPSLTFFVSWKSQSAKGIPAPFFKLLEKKKKIQAKARPPDAVTLAGASFGCRRACITQTPLVWSFSGTWGWENPDTCWPLWKSVMSKLCTLSSITPPTTPTGISPLDFTTWCSTLHLLSLCALNVLRHLNVTL